MEENKNVKSVHLSKARVVMALAFSALLGSVSTYIYPLTQGVFDFGFLFELFSLFLVFIAFNYTKYEQKILTARTLMLVSMFPVGFLIVYDILGVIAIGNVQILTLLGDLAYTMILEGVFLILAFYSYIELSRAHNPENYKKPTDFFYEKDADIAEDRQKIMEAEQREIQEAKEEVYFESLMEDRDK